ncbi:Hypothetical predicted protein [Pelobates cultripes]|uniref:Uncharacterized protein n=1 Tax=Pelobates cultripes TaxID=61616 RepID=A0AAD1WAU9_PELCU|nr:Hypothetical predicted protein [Pelobates cultripes]
MDPHPEASLSGLYKKDWFYARCVSHLMSAPPSVSKQFLKEQRDLTQSLKKLDRHLQSRLDELNEEKKRFAQLMSKRLGSNSVTNLAPTKSGFKTLCTQSTATFNDSSADELKTSDDSNLNTLKHIKVTYPSIIPKDQPKNKCQTIKHLTKRGRTSSARLSEGISKTISQAAYKQK